MCRPQYGSIKQFLQNHSEEFTILDGNQVCLKENAGKFKELGMKTAEVSTKKEAPVTKPERKQSKASEKKKAEKKVKPSKKRSSGMSAIAMSTLFVSTAGVVVALMYSKPSNVKDLVDIAQRYSLETSEYVKDISIDLFSHLKDQVLKLSSPPRM